MSAVDHAYDGESCESCMGPCTVQKWVPPFRSQYRETCPHPQDELTEGRPLTACTPEVVTVCNRCGLSFPGQTKGDLLVA